MPLVLEMKLDKGLFKSNISVEYIESVTCSEHLILYHFLKSSSALMNMLAL